MVCYLVWTSVVYLHTSYNGKLAILRCKSNMTVVYSVDSMTTLYDCNDFLRLCIRMRERPGQCFVNLKHQTDRPHFPLCQFLVWWCRCLCCESRWRRWMSGLKVSASRPPRPPQEWTNIKSHFIFHCIGNSNYTHTLVVRVWWLGCHPIGPLPMLLLR